MKIVVVLLASASAAIAKEKINVYSVPKEISPARKPVTAEEPVVSKSPAPVQWKTPASWKQLSPTELRVGNFSIGNGEKKAEVSIIPFPRQTGTELGNVNQWGGEIGLKAIEQKEVSSEEVLIGADKGKLYDLSGSALRTVAAVLQRDGTSWFFKMRGDKELVAQNKTLFVEFLKTIRFDSEMPAEPAVASNPVSTNVKEISGKAPSNETSWDAPATWQEKPPSAMVLKSFSTGDAEHEAKISITAFPGDVGGALANVNRWRNQLSLEPIAEAELSKLTTFIDVLGGKATLVDMKGSDGKTGKPARLIAATVSRKEKTWFYKMMGNEATVAREKEVFVKFVQTVRYPND